MSLIKQLIPPERIVEDPVELPEIPRVSADARPVFVVYLPQDIGSANTEDDLDFPNLGSNNWAVV